MASERAPIGVCAGKDHEVLVNWVQGDGVMAAVAPAGIPLTVSMTGAGKLIPAVGAIRRGYVAVPPGAAVCDVIGVPPPLPVPVPEVEVKLKLSIDWVRTLLVDPAKFVSPL